MRWPAPLEALVAANIGVFAAWLLASPRWMTRHFEVSWGSVVKRPWTLLTATVSHSDLYSLIGNLQVQTASSSTPWQLEHTPCCTRSLLSTSFCPALSQSCSVTDGHYGAIFLPLSPLTLHLARCGAAMLLPDSGDLLIPFSAGGIRACCPSGPVFCAQYILLKPGLRACQRPIITKDKL